MRRCLIALAIAGSPVVLAQTSVKPPAIGAVRDAAGKVQAVIGVPGAFVLSSIAVSNAISAAFSGSAGLVKTADALYVLDAAHNISARHEAPPGRALFAFDAAGAPALVDYGGSLWRFDSGRLQRVPWHGAAIAIALEDSESASILVRRGHGTWKVIISLVHGAVRSQALLPEVAAPVALLAGGSVLFGRRHELVVRDRNNVERYLAANFTIASFEPMAPGWVSIHEANGTRRFALHVTPDDLALYQIPEVE